MIDFGEELNIHAQSAVQIWARLSYQSLSKLFLKHQNCASKHRFLGKQFEDQGRADLIRNISHADIKKGKLNLKTVSWDEGELVGVLAVLESFREFSNHARVDFDCNNLFGSLKQ